VDKVTAGKLSMLLLHRNRSVPTLDSKASDQRRPQSDDANEELHIDSAC